MVSSTDTQPLLEDFADELHYAFEKNEVVCALFVDVSKAFDSVNPSILFQKLYHIGFRGPFLELLKDYLTGRSQQVHIGPKRSSKLALKSGVPQGSILAPLLFNVFVNDMSDSIVSCKLYQYADDTVLLSRHIEYEKSIFILQRETAHLIEWFQQNDLKINNTKTRLVCFRNPLKVVIPDTPLFLHSSICPSCKCTPVGYVDHVKYLGIEFDSDLSWNAHMGTVCKKLRRVSCLLYNMRSLVPQYVKKMVINALAYSVLRYGITIYGGCSMLWQKKIDNILTGMFRSITYGTDTESEQEKIDHINLPLCHALFTETVVLRHFWDDRFKVPHIAPRALRHTTRFEVPRMSTRYGRRQRIFYVPDIFNSLPEKVLDLD